jgi:hypothetical protein
MHAASFDRPVLWLCAAIALGSMAAPSQAAETVHLFNDGDGQTSRFSGEGRVSSDGRRLALQGLGYCESDGSLLQVSVSVLQPEQQASARGYSDLRTCDAGYSEFAVELTAREGTPGFAAGPIQACAMSQSRTSDDVRGFDQWCVFVELTTDPAL